MREVQISQLYERTIIYNTIFKHLQYKICFIKKIVHTFNKLFSLRKVIIQWNTMQKEQLFYFIHLRNIYNFIHLVANKIYSKWFSKMMLVDWEIISLKHSPKIHKKVYDGLRGVRKPLKMEKCLRQKIKAKQLVFSKYSWCMGWCWGGVIWILLDVIQSENFIRLHKIGQYKVIIWVIMYLTTWYMFITLIHN